MTVSKKMVQVPLRHFLFFVRVFFVCCFFTVRREQRRKQVVVVNDLFVVSEEKANSSTTITTLIDTVTPTVLPWVLIKYSSSSSPTPPRQTKPSSRCLTKTVDRPPVIGGVHCLQVRSPLSPSNLSIWHKPASQAEEREREREPVSTYIYTNEPIKWGVSLDLWHVRQTNNNTTATTEQQSV